MSNTDKRKQEMNEQALYEELEIRYGAGLAQEIVDQIKKTDDKSHKPEYMAVKALSEALEIFRADSQKIIKKLRNIKSNDLPANIPSLDEKRLQNELKQLLKCYWLVQHSFYTLYERALKICEVPAYKYDRVSEPTEMKSAA